MVRARFCTFCRRPKAACSQDARCLRAVRKQRDAAERVCNHALDALASDSPALATEFLRDFCLGLEEVKRGKV